MSIRPRATLVIFKVLERDDARLEGLFQDESHCAASVAAVESLDVRHIVRVSLAALAAGTHLSEMHRFGGQSNRPILSVLPAGLRLVTGRVSKQRAEQAGQVTEVVRMAWGHLEARSCGLGLLRSVDVVVGIRHPLVHGQGRRGGKGRRRRAFAAGGRAGGGPASGGGEDDAKSSQNP